MTRLRFTPRALAVASVFVASALLAAFGLESAWIVAALTGAALGLSVPLALREARALASVSLPPRFVAHAGRSTPVAVELELRRPMRHATLTLLTDSARPRDVESAPGTAVLDLRESRRATLFVRLPRRGRLDGLSLLVRTSFPFGLVRAERVHRATSDVTGLPRLRQTPARALVDHVRLGGQRQAAIIEDPRRGGLGRGLPHGLRPYRAGDTARDVSWPASLARGRLLSHERERWIHRPPIHLLLSTAIVGTERGGMRETSGAFEAAVSHAATAFSAYAREGRRVSILLVEDGQAQGPAHVSLDALVDVEPRADRRQRRDDVIAEVLARDPGGGLTVGFVALSPLEFQRAAVDADRPPPTERPTEGSKGGRTIILGVDPGGRCAPLALPPAPRQWRGVPA